MIPTEVGLLLFAQVHRGSELKVALAVAAILDMVHVDGSERLRAFESGTAPT